MPGSFPYTIALGMIFGVVLGYFLAVPLVRRIAPRGRRSIVIGFVSLAALIVLLPAVAVAFVMGDHFSNSRMQTTHGALIVNAGIVAVVGVCLAVLLCVAAAIGAALGAIVSRVVGGKDAA